MAASASRPTVPTYAHALRVTTDHAPGDRSVPTLGVAWGLIVRPRIL
jgi:hypothetical protein